MEYWFSSLISLAMTAVVYSLRLLLVDIAESSSAPCARVTMAWSVHLYICCLSHLCALLKLLDGMRCHLAGTLVCSK